jgi:hypothetical protein
MLIIVDKKIPDQAKEKLSYYGEILELETNGITYEAISGHPDIFFFKAGIKLIAAPNTPGEFLEKIMQHEVPLLKGLKPVGANFPATASYNAVCNEKYLIHNFRITDIKILSEYISASKISVHQGYCRCNLLSLRNNCFITSDKGIQYILERNKIKSHYVSPESIILPGYKHGFFGGTCGIAEDKIFFLGNLRFYRDGRRVKKILSNLDYDIIELYNGPLYDGGSITFI